MRTLGVPKFPGEKMRKHNNHTDTNKKINFKLVLLFMKSYLLLMMIFAVVIFLVLSYMRQRQIDFITQRNSSVAEQVLNSFEEKVLVIKKFSQQIATREFYQFARLDQEEAMQNQDTLLHIRSSCVNYSVFSEFGEYAICFDKSGVAFGSYSVCTDINRFYGTLFQFGDMSANEFFSYKKQLPAESFLPYSTMEFPPRSYEGMIYYIKLYPYSDSSASLFFVLRDTYLDQLFEPIENSKIMVRNNQGAVLYTRNWSDEDAERYMWDGQLNLEALNQDYILTVQKGVGIDYICMTSREELFGGVNSLFLLLFAIFLVLIVGMVAIIAAISSHNSVWVQKILLHRKSGYSETKGSIYKEISDAFDVLQHDNLILQGERDSSMEMLRRNFFLNLLMGKAKQPYDYTLLGNGAGARWEQYGLVMASLEYRAPDGETPDLQLLRRSFESWYQEAEGRISREGYVVCLETGRMAAVVKEEDRIDAVAQMLLESAEAVHMEDALEVRVSAAMQVMRVEELYQAAQAGSRFLGRESFRPESRGLCSPFDAQEIPDTRLRPASEEKTKVLFTAAKSGNLKEAEELLRDIFQKTAEFVRSDEEKTEFLARISQLLLLLDSGESFSEKDWMDALRQIPMSGTMFACLYASIRRICLENKKLQKSKKDTAREEFREKVRLLVDEELSNQEMSLNYAAEKLGFSHAYFSSLFKENMGENFSAYLERLRMQKAHALVLEGQYTLDEIAGMCGYANSNTFRRIYRKVYGVTPSMMRSMKKQEEQQKKAKKNEE